MPGHLSVSASLLLPTGWLGSLLQGAYMTMWTVLDHLVLGFSAGYVGWLLCEWHVFSRFRKHTEVADETFRSSVELDRGVSASFTTTRKLEPGQPQKIVLGQRTIFAGRIIRRESRVVVRGGRIVELFDISMVDELTFQEMRRR